MEDIFEIKFTFEQYVKDNVILKFSNKQGGDFNVFGYYWQCFVWAAVIGFLKEKRRPLKSPLADKVFSLRTMKNNDGEKDAQALICLCLAKSGSVDIMKNPNDAIQMINEYANGGFYYILHLMENGENTFNDLEKVKQEIFSRNYDIDGEPQPMQPVEEYVVPKEAFAKDEEKESKEEEVIVETPTITPRKSHRWTFKEEKELVGYYNKGMTIEQLALLFRKDEESVKEKLAQKGFTVYN